MIDLHSGNMYYINLTQKKNKYSYTVNFLVIIDFRAKIAKVIV